MIAMSKDRIIRYLYRNVAVKKQTLIKIIDAVDTDEDGRISLGELAAALKMLWRSAMGKIKPAKKKIRTVD